jgi:hypothetical protein
MALLRKLVDQLEAGFYVVPEIQRAFVWRNSQVRDLLASIYNKFPIGSIIIWEMPQIFVKDYADLLRPFADDLQQQNSRYMVIDGQQRLASLLLIYKGALAIGGSRRNVDIYFNPHQEKFALQRRPELKSDPEWFNVSNLMSMDVEDVLETKAREARDPALVGNRVVAKKLRELKNNLDTYEVNLVEAGIGYSGDFLDLFEKISQIFVVLNSKGTRIRLPDLVLALMTGRMRKEVGFSFREEVMSIINAAQSKDWEIDETVLMRIYMAVATGTTKFAAAKEKLDQMNAMLLRSLLSATGNTLKHSINLLRMDIGIKGPEHLQSKYLLATIVYLLYKDSISLGKPLAEAAKRELARWLIMASLQGRYTGRLESELGEDVTTITDGKGARGLIENLRYKQFSEAYLVGDYDKAHLALLLGIYCQNSARDWDLTALPQPLPIKQVDPTNLAIHHIFPKDFLKQHYKGDGSPDDVANTTLISNRANESIGNRAPREYLVELSRHDPELISKHLIPGNVSLWEADKYDAFLAERRKLILGAAEHDLGITVIKAT